MKKIRKIMTGAALAAALFTGTEEAQAKSAELFVGENSTTLDVKVGAEIANNTNLFVRNRTTKTYNGDINNFGLADLSYGLGNGFGAVTEIQVLDDEVSAPRFGIEYFKQFSSTSLYGLLTVSTDADAEALVGIAKELGLKGDLKAKIRFENVTNFDKDGHNFSIQRIRTGLEKGNFEYGLGIDRLEAGRNTSHNVGIYGTVKF